MDISVANFKALIDFQELWNLLWKFSFQTACYSGERSISKILELLFSFVSNEFFGGFFGISLHVICYLLKDLKSSCASAIT